MAATLAVVTMMVVARVVIEVTTMVMAMETVKTIVIVVMVLEYELHIDNI